MLLPISIIHLFRVKRSKHNCLKWYAANGSIFSLYCYTKSFVVNCVSFCSTIFLSANETTVSCLDYHLMSICLFRLLKIETMRAYMHVHLLLLFSVHRSSFIGWIANKKKNGKEKKLKFKCSEISQAIEAAVINERITMLISTIIF